LATGNSRRVERDFATQIAADECEQVIETEGSVPVEVDEAAEHDQDRQSGRGKSQ